MSAPANVPLLNQPEQPLGEQIEKCREDFHAFVGMMPNLRSQDKFVGCMALMLKAADLTLKAAAKAAKERDPLIKTV